MKKGFVALLVVLALVIIVSPGIIGKLAEKSVDENINRAAEGSGELIVTTSGFDGGWFTSEGEHRIELGQGGLRDALGIFGGADGSDLPVLIVNTRMDHGIIPVTSLSRENGSLAPGLGNAISTVSLELDDGEIVEIPGTIFSDVALNGDLTSQYVLEAGSRDVDGGRIEWQPATIDIEADASDGGYSFSGTLDGATLSEGGQVMTLNATTFSGDQQPSGHGFNVGDIAIETGGVSIENNGAPMTTFGGLTLNTNTELDGAKVQSDFDVTLDKLVVPGVGNVTYAMKFESSSDAAAYGRMMQTLQKFSDNTDPSFPAGELERESRDLFAAGMEINIPQFDVTLPMGKVEAAMSFSTPEQDRDSFEWSSLLLQGKANLDMKIPETLVQMATAMSAEAGMLVGAGYLEKDGDFYIMDADMEKGLLTVNGAPIPIPVGAF